MTVSQLAMSLSLIQIKVCLFSCSLVTRFSNFYLYCVPPQVKYSNTHNTEQKSLKITGNTLTSIWTLCAKLQVSSVSGSWYYYLLSATHQKCNFPKRNCQCWMQSTVCKAITVTNGVQNVHVTFFLTKHFNPNTILATVDKVKSVSVLTSQ